MNKAYSALSAVYERLIADEQYEKWAERVVKTLDENVKGKVGFDLACGSGYFTRAIKKAGYAVTGVDISQEMLVEAQKNCLKENLNIPFLRQDMTCLKSFNKVDFLTIINDGVNYSSPDDLKRAFKAFYKTLNAGGVLFFDFSTEYKLKNVIGNNLFAEDYDDLTYLWFNKLYDTHIQMDLSVFTKVGGYYEKREETHIQYIHTLDFMVGSLKEVGFLEVKASAFGGGEIAPDTLRIEILAVK